MTRVHVEVTGTVQGVLFRDSLRREARSRGVSGWVRNTASGAVEAELEGGRADVDALVDWCRTGPPGASVSDVVATATDPTGETGFTVR